jgi:hypothetical protein
LAFAEVALSEEELEGVVVSVEDEVSAAIQVVTELLAGVDDGEELLFVDSVVELSRGELAGLVADGLGALALVLQEHSTNALA